MTEGDFTSTTAGLLPEEYQAIVAPALHAAADLAAQRGDPYLYNDLASMLTLMVLIRDLADLYQDQYGALGQSSPPDTFKTAPLAACVMVLSEYEIEPEKIAPMSAALTSANAQLVADNIIGPERKTVQQAWQALLADDQTRMHSLLKRAAAQIAKAIDGWEEHRHDVH